MVRLLSLFLVSLNILVLSGCDVSESLGRSTDVTRPSFLGASNTEGYPIAGSEPLLVKFSEPMNIDSVVVTPSGVSVAEYSLAWNSASTELSLVPHDSWPAGTFSISIVGKDQSGLEIQDEISVVFSTSFTISQYKASELSLSSNFKNEWVWGNQLINENGLMLTDYESGLLHYYVDLPELDAMPSYSISSIGVQSEDGVIQSKNLIEPQSISSYDSKVLISNLGSHQVYIFDKKPLRNEDNTGVILGNGSAECSANAFNTPEMAFAAGGKLFVADALNNRVLIWKDLEQLGQAPDLVIGQNGFVSCIANDNDQNGVEDDIPSARTLNYPSAVWSDGEKLLVLDSGNNRLLVWNSLPDSNFIEADLVLGQASFLEKNMNLDVSDKTLTEPYLGLYSNSRQIFVTDSGANRVLIWNDWPTENYESANVVLGQGDFNSSVENDNDRDGTADLAPNLSTMHFPSGVSYFGGNLYITDSLNGRVLHFKED